MTRSACDEGTPSDDASHPLPACAMLRQAGEAAQALAYFVRAAPDSHMRLPDRRSDDALTKHAGRFE